MCASTGGRKCSKFGSLAWLPTSRRRVCWYNAGSAGGMAPGGADKGGKVRKARTKEAKGTPKASQKIEAVHKTVIKVDEIALSVMLAEIERAKEKATHCITARGKIQLEDCKRFRRIL